MAQDSPAGGLIVLATPESTSTPEPTPTPNDEALVTDAQWYADHFDVSPEEALDRLSLQGAVGELAAKLRQQEPERFAGLWVENEPQYRVVVAFTENGQEIIQPYIQGQPYEKYVIVRNQSYTHAQLRAIQQQGMAIARQLDIVISSGIDVQKNRVTLDVGNPQLFLEEVKAAGLTLPAAIEVVAIDPDNLSDTLRGGLFTYTLPDGRPIYFPKQPPQAFYYEGDFEGRLTLDDEGCLRLEERPGYAPLILWRHDLDLYIEGDKIEIRNNQGQAVAQVGDLLAVGGGVSDTVHDIPQMPIAACSGPYLLLGEHVRRPE